MPCDNNQVLDLEAGPRSSDAVHLEGLSISVVVAWVNSLELLCAGLESLERQSGRRPDEVIVVTRRGEDEQERLRGLYPTITVLSAPPNTPITALRSQGIRRARGNVIVVTEDHCVPASDWITRVEQRMRGRDCDVVGGPVENATTVRQRDWAAFLTEYAGSIKPAKDQAVSQQLPGNNVAYRRELIDGLCATLDQGLWESFYHRHLTERGVHLQYDPRMLVYHSRPFDFWYFARQRYHFCRSLAAMRCNSFTAFDRVKYGLGSTLLPPLLLLRGLLTVSRKRRLVKRYLSCLPLIGLYLTIGAFGEMIGYFLGGGDSLVKVE